MPVGPTWGERKRVPFLILLLLPFIVAGMYEAGVACDGPGFGGSVSSASASGTITFGSAISITGRTAKEGEYARDGYQFFVDTANELGGIKVGDKSYKIKLKYYDDESKPERSAALFEKLINEDKVDFLLGPYGSAPTGLVAPIAEKYKIPMVAGHGSAGSIYSRGYRYIVGIQTPARYYSRGIIDAVLAKDPAIKTIAILGESDPFSDEVTNGAAAYATDKGLQIVFNEDYPSGTQDVSGLLKKIKALNPDILLSSGHLQDSLLVVRQSKLVGVSPKAMGFTVGPSSPEFRQNLKQDADYILGATQWTSALKFEGDDYWKTPSAFADAFRAKYTNYKTVPYHVAESVAALIVFQKALEKANSLDREKVREALLGLDIDTFFAHIKLDAHGVNSGKPMVVEQLQPDGKKYTVFPLAVAEKHMLYPMPAWDNR